jgi:SAM-dependent methyltransferase
VQQQEYKRLQELEEHYWWFVGRRNTAFEMLDLYAPEGYTLDVGCGTGYTLSLLESAEGVDAFEEAVRLCHGRGLKNVRLADAQKLPFPERTFDRAICLDVLEHVPNDNAALREIRRVLKPGGTLVLTVPAYRWLWGPHDVALMHQRRYGLRELRKKLQNTGFEPIHLSHTVFFLFPLVVLVRLCEKLQKNKKPEAKLMAIPSWLNRVLIRLQTWEGKIASSLTLPWGSTIVAAARRPKE